MKNEQARFIQMLLMMYYKDAYADISWNPEYLSKVNVQMRNLCDDAERLFDITLDHSFIRHN